MVVVQKKLRFLVAVVPWLLTSCTTDNTASRVLDVDGAAPAMETEDDDSDSPSPPASGPNSQVTDESESDPPDASASDAGFEDAGSDAGLVEEAGLTPLEQAQLEFERFYAAHCPDQPADVMLERGAGKVIPAGPLLSGTPSRPQLTEGAANELYTLRHALAAGGVYTVSYTGDAAEVGAAGVSADAGFGGVVADAGARDAGSDAGPPAVPLGERQVTYGAEDDWYPVDQIEDVNKIVPGMVVDANGNGTHTTIQSAINDAVRVAGCPRVYIEIEPGTYREKIIVPAKTSAPPLTLYSVESDASRTLIVWGDSTAGAQVDGTPLSIHYSATLSQSLPTGFQARNLTVANDYLEGTYPGDDQAAVAVMNQGDKAEYDNVRFIGNRNTLYVKSTAPNEVSRAYFRDCYVEGDEDIVLGRGTAAFDQCEFHSVGDRVSTGAVTAPSTRLDNPHGILITNSEFSADAIVTDVHLGHQWFEGQDEEAVGKVIIRNSILGPHIRREDPWAPTERLTARSPDEPTPVVLFSSREYYPPGGGLSTPEIFIAEYGNSGPGAAW